MLAGMKDGEAPGGGRGEMLVALLTLAFGAMLVTIAVDQLARGRKGCGCNDDASGD